VEDRSIMISSKEKSKQIIKKHFPFLVFLFRKAKYPYWILRKIYKENEKIIVYKIFGKKPIETNGVLEIKNLWKHIGK
jgi:hypothetical protein